VGRDWFQRTQRRFDRGLGFKNRRTRIYKVIFFSLQRAKTLASIVRKGSLFSPLPIQQRLCHFTPILLIPSSSLYGEGLGKIVKGRFSPLICSKGERSKGSACLSLTTLLKTPLNYKSREDGVRYRSKGVGFMVDGQGEVLYTSFSPDSGRDLTSVLKIPLSVIKFTPINYLKPPIEPPSLTLNMTPSPVVTNWHQSLLVVQSLFKGQSLLFYPSPFNVSTFL